MYRCCLSPWFGSSHVLGDTTSHSHGPRVGSVLRVDLTGYYDQGENVHYSSPFRNGLKSDARWTHIRRVGMGSYTPTAPYTSPMRKSYRRRSGFHFSNGRGSFSQPLISVFYDTLKRWSSYHRLLQGSTGGSAPQQPSDVRQPRVQSPASIRLRAPSSLSTGAQLRTPQPTTPSTCISADSLDRIRSHQPSTTALHSPKGTSESVRRVQ